MDGVDVDYSIGTYMGAHAYRVISSVQVPQGDVFNVHPIFWWSNDL